MMIHTVLLAAILLTLFVEGAQRADWLFLALGIAVELS